MAGDTTGDVTQLLIDWSNGDEEALARLMPLVYDELHGLAARYLRRRHPEQTLQTTALVHEAYLRLIDQRRVQWRNRLHFIALSAKMMRRILADHARRQLYAKRGGGAPVVSLEEAREVPLEEAPDLAAVDEALSVLSELDAELGKIVELRFFGGLTSEQIAELLGVSVPTVTRRWAMAKAWLYRYLTTGAVDGERAPETD